MPPAKTLTFQDLIRIAFERGNIAAPDGESAEAWIADRMRQRESTRRHGADRWVYAQSSGRWVQVNDRRSIEGGLAAASLEEGAPRPLVPLTQTVFEGDGLAFQFEIGDTGPATALIVIHISGPYRYARQP